jgi:hypothetical protein
MAMLSGVDQEFLRDENVASLEVTAAQFVIIANVLKLQDQGTTRETASRSATPVS